MLSAHAPTHSLSHATPVSRSASPPKNALPDADDQVDPVVLEEDPVGQELRQLQACFLQRGSRVNVAIRRRPHSPATLRLVNDAWSYEATVEGFRVRPRRGSWWSRLLPMRSDAVDVSSIQLARRWLWELKGARVRACQVGILARADLAVTGGVRDDAPVLAALKQRDQDCHDGYRLNLTYPCTVDSGEHDADPVDSSFQRDKCIGNVLVVVVLDAMAREQEVQRLFARFRMLQYVILLKATHSGQSSLECGGCIERLYHRDTQVRSFLGIQSDS